VTQPATGPRIVGITSVYGENTLMLIVWINAERYAQEIYLHKKSKEVRNTHFENVGFANDSMKSPVGKNKQSDSEQRQCS
jgi:hypothetical protein